MRILLTGGNGFIGRALAAALSPRHDVRAPSRRELDLLDAAAVREHLRRQPVDAIVHGATTPGHRNAPPAPDLAERNLRMFDALARDGAFERFVVLGSGAEYDASRPIDGVTEAEFDARAPTDPTGASKHEISRRCAGDGRFTVLRLFGVFGPGEDWEIRFVSNALCKAIHGLPITLRQDRRFHYLWVEDLAPVLERVLAAPPPDPAYNVVPDAPSSLAALARLAREVAGADVPIRIAAPGEGLPYVGSNALLRSRFPGLAFTPERAAVERLHGWYLARKGAIDPSLLARDK